MKQITAIEGLSVSKKAEKKILKWANEQVLTQMGYFLNALKDEEAIKARYEDQKADYIKTILLNQEKVMDAVGDFQKTKEVLKTARYKDNSLTRIFVDEFIFADGTVNTSKSQKDYTTIMIKYLVDTFGEEVVMEDARKEKETREKKAQKEQEESKYRLLESNISLAVGYIDFLKENFGYQIREEKNGKFTKYVCHHPETNKYFIAKRSNAYKAFHEIMKYAFHEHDGDILKAVECIENKYQAIKDGWYKKS